VGIAATALGEWVTARDAWRAAGVAIPDETGPIEMNLGRTPIRIRPYDAPEVVWTERMDPARAVIVSVPFPESGRRYEDVVLHDGEPRGERLSRGRKVSVFDELALLQPSSYETWRLELMAPTFADLDAAASGLVAANACVDDWTEARVLCAKCSLGSEPHEHEPREVWTPQRRLGVAVRDMAPFATLDAWARNGAGRSFAPPVRVL
jgi:hypothetical protein